MTRTSPSTLQARRAAVAAACPGWTLLLPCGTRSVRNATVTNPFRHDADYFYLTGLDEPDGWLVLRPGGDAVLYLPGPDRAHARWVGPRLSLAEAAARSGVADVRPAGLLAAELIEHVRACDVLGWRLGEDAASDARVIGALAEASQARLTGRVRRPVHDPHGPIGRLRSIKDAAEIDRMRQAARATAAAHVALMRGARAGDTGLSLAGRLEAACLERGAQRMAYGSIVARGPEAVCLHGAPGAEPLGEGEMVLVDAGCEIDGYACDLTRTWPVDGRFSPAHAALYDAVLEAQHAALGAARPGSDLDAVHAAALAVLARACARLGLPGEVARWFPHNTSHWIGLDVHDAGPYRDGDAPVRLEPGMAFTVEPGLYIDPDASDAPPELRGVGVRVEDTVVVTAQGIEILTRDAPSSRPEVEALRGALIRRAGPRGAGRRRRRGRRPGGPGSATPGGSGSASRR